MASAAFDGITTFSPGTAQNQASKFCECWAPLGPPTPHIVRIVSGSEWPVKYRYLAAWLTIWSIASIAKSKNMISTIGRSPTAAAPVPRPTSSGLGDRRVADPLGAEFVEQAAGDP